MKQFNILFHKVGILAAFLLMGIAFAQTPGGISGFQIEYWLKADEVAATLPADGADVTTWQDLSGNNRHFGNTAPNPFFPKFKKSGMNYHSTVNFPYIDNEDGANISAINNARRRLIGTNSLAPVATDRSYFVIWVSKVDRELTNGSTGNTGTVFRLNGNTEGTGGTQLNAYGWQVPAAGASLLHTTANTNYRHNRVGDEYGIGIAVMPNNTTTAQQQFLNALPSTTTMAGRVMGSGTLPSVIGLTSSSNAEYYDAFYGEVMEIIVLSKAGTGNTLTAQELKHINSYLSIKYGITLHSTQKDYVLSDGTVVYDAAASGYTAYDKNIFGIVRDDSGGLYQKQSKSADEGSAFAVSLGNFAETNAENTAVLTDKHALMLGTNGVFTGETSYSHDVGTVFQNHTLGSDEKITALYNYKLRAKTTGQASFTVNTSGAKGDFLLVSSDENFAPGSTRIYKVSGNKADNIVINDGDYIGFAYYKRTPGGIDIDDFQIEYWLSADDVSAANGEDVTLWNDRSQFGRNFGKATGNNFFPKFSKSAMNFHSALDFNAVDGVSAANNQRRKLVGVNSLVPAANRSYYVLYVSRLGEGSSTNATVFHLNASNTAGTTQYNSFGWGGSGVNVGKLQLRSNAATNTHSTKERDYGIGLAVLPNATGAANNRQLFLNALASTGMSASVMGNGTNPSVIGGSDYTNGNTNSFSGEVMEVIVFSKSGTGNTLTAQELKQINTHLAIKYGITLNDTQKDYLLSGGIVVYNSASAGYTTYNKDIFGIARDNASGLYQKQSASTENPSLMVYLGDLAENNEENTSVLTDKHALMFGANGLTVGNDYYIWNEGTQFQNYTLSNNIGTHPDTGLPIAERLNSLMKYKLRAKATGQSSFAVNMRPGLGQYLLVSQDENFAPANTRIYKIEEGKVENVVINDGDYIGFAFYMRAPGGVTNGLKMWLNASKPNTITTNASNEITSWTDYAGFGTTYVRRTTTGAAGPLYVCNESTNFHPTAQFRKEQDYLVTYKAPFSVARPSNVSFYTVLNHDLASNDRSYFVGFGTGTTLGAYASRQPAFGVFRQPGNGTKGLGRYVNTVSLTSNSTVALFNTGATTLAGYHWVLGSRITFDFDGYQNTINTTYNTPVMNSYGTLGAASIGGAALRGFMPEVLAYEGILSQVEIDKLNSYFGLKYAITVDKDKTSGTVNFDFLLSDGTSVWNGNDAVYRAYHHNIASVIRDDDSDLYNRQARSTDVGAVIHMGTGIDLGCGTEQGNIVKDKSAVTWGHNNAAPMAVTSLIGNPNICGALDSRMTSKVWLVNNTDFNQPVSVAAYGTNFPYEGAGWKVFMLVADSPAKLSANQWNQMIPMTYVNGKHITNYKFAKDEIMYITFGAKAAGGVCENGCEFSGVKSVNFKGWTRGSKGPHTYNLGDGFNVTATIDDPSSKMYLSAYYPRFFNANSGLRINRKGQKEPITTRVVFTKDNGDAVAAAGTFEVIGVDRLGSRPDDIEVIGLCNGTPVFPKLSYVYRRPERSTYTIDQGGKAVAKPYRVPWNGFVPTTARGRVFVEFDVAVEEIHIVYKLNTPNTPAFLKNLNNYVGIGKMDFYCPAPLPAPNEDGLILTKQGTPEVLLCEMVDYTFRAVNTNCADKAVTFTDTLPAGMVWVNNSLSGVNFDTDGDGTEDVTATGYGTGTLTVSGLTIPGGGDTYTFRASAIFEESAAAGAYANRAAFNYDRDVAGVPTPITLQSTDRLTGEDNTITNALASDRPKMIETVFSMDKNCFKLDEELEITVNINNPNAFIMNDMFLSLNYESEIFTLVPGSIKTSAGLTLGANQGEAGSGTLEFSGFKLPAGTSWVKYKVKSSDNLADYELDPVTANPLNVFFGYELASESDDTCLATTTANANGEREIPFCTFCVQPPVAATGDLVKSKVGISVMKENFTGWPENVPNGYLVLEAGKKGMVITRTTPDAIGAANWVKGMIIFDTSADKKCLSIYNGTDWKCIERSCNE